MYSELLDIEVGHTLENEGVPYLSIEFVQNNNSGTVLIKVPKVSLAVTPSFAFNSETLVNIPLNFIVINSNIEIYEYN